MGLPARIYIGAMVACAAAITSVSLISWQGEELTRLIAYLLMAAVASTLKIRLPQLVSSVTPGFLFVLLAIADLSLAATTLVCLLAGLVQTLWKPAHRPKTIQVAFNSAALTVCGAVAHAMAHTAIPGTTAADSVGRVAIALVTLFFANIIAVSTVIALVQSKSLAEILRTANYWAFPYYLVGTVIALVIQYSVPLGLAVTLQQMPLVYLAHLFYSQYVTRQQG